MKNQISLSGMCLVAVLLLAAGSPPLAGPGKDRPRRRTGVSPSCGRPKDDKHGRPQHPGGPKLDEDE